MIMMVMKGHIELMLYTHIYNFKFEVISLKLSKQSRCCPLEGMINKNIYFWKENPSNDIS